ncbi:hypothetical protein K443DRAFT_672778 [Laccaria amethystina LaAM-08-1]|uniref:Alcohol acetyltransferase n=1 Tax=Laccaria amethystina LaAM-08-1 TaxID=1095629 RepID=A0A0C9X7T0_9AGAR|nr:hypothetical protein K443DRAFT_672778 [Laccaria amethystina LaAM-08-1]
MNISAWTRIELQSGSLAYERRLGVTELGFYWDTVFERTADTIQHVELEIQQSDRMDLVDLRNVGNAWLTLKQQFPLLGARLEEREEGKEVFFVVDQAQLVRSRPEEIEYRTVSSGEQAQAIVDKVVIEQCLSNDLPAKVLFLPRIDQPNIFHIVVIVAHCITDGTANTTIIRTFLDYLCSASSRNTTWPLEQRLALSVASEEVDPNRHLSPAKKRWRRAIGYTIAALRASKISGGHTLPRKVSPVTRYTPARSSRIDYSFSKELSNLILQTCHRNHITFGSAYPVIAQVALTRVLCRRYIRGDISQMEWQFRRREPMVTGGPLSLRPFLDQEWFKQGGASNVSLAISFFDYTLPFMPLGSASSILPGSALPSFHQLLSPQRFLLRCISIKRQAAHLIKHPLFLEIAGARMPERAESLRNFGSHWRRDKAAPKDLDDGVISAVEQASKSPVWTHGGSSFGNADLLLPREYPTTSEPSAAALIRIRTSTNHLRCRPTELYLGATTIRQQLHLHVFSDSNVYDEETVKEWLEEVKNATTLYLG